MNHFIKTKKARNQDGQSLIEFLVLIPLFLGLVWILIRMHSVIQVSMVQQKYLRTVLHQTLRNSPYYPYRELVPLMIGRQGTDFEAFVAEESSVNDNIDNPTAPTVKLIDRVPFVPENEPIPQQISTTPVNVVRVRSSMVMCSPHHMLRASQSALTFNHFLKDEDFSTLQMCIPGGSP